MTTNETTTAAATSLAAARGDAAAVLLIELQGYGALIKPISGGWEVTYSADAPAATPWITDEGDLFATSAVGT
jgi:hypothetical protein